MRNQRDDFKTINAWMKAEWIDNDWEVSELQIKANTMIIDWMEAHETYYGDRAEEKKQKQRKRFMRLDELKEMYDKRC